MSSGVWGGLAAVLFTPVIMVLLYRIYPVSSAPTYFRDEDVPAFRRWRWTGGLLALPYVAGTGVLTYRWLRWLEVSWLPNLAETEFAYLPGTESWVFVGLLLTLGHVGHAVALLNRARWAARISEYDAFCNQQNKLNSKGLWNLLSLLCLLAAFVTVILLRGHYFLFYPERVVFSRLLSFKEEQQSYRDLMQIIHTASVRAPAGNLVPVPAYLFVFRDGTRLSTHGLPARRSDTCGPVTLGEWLSETAGVRVEERRVMRTSEL